MPRGAKPFFTPEQDREVAARYQAGETLRQIGDSYRVSYQPVRASLARSGITSRAPADYGWKPTPENAAEVERLWREGMSVPKIARTVSTRNDTISRVLRDRGIEARFGGQNRRFKGAQVEVLAAEYEAGASLNELAARYGGSAPLIRNTLRRRGVQLRAKGTRRYWTAERLTWLREQHEGGRTNADIARELGFSQRAIGEQLRKLGIMPRTPFLKGPAHHSWTGGRRIRDSGYVEVKLPDDDPMAVMRATNGYVPEHRLVMARKLGRPLLPGEQPHHKNLIRTDNDPDNLELWVTSQPSGARVADLIEWSLTLLDRYMPDVLVPNWQDAPRPEEIA